MPAWLSVTLLTLAAGLAIPAGAIIACCEHIRPDWLETEFRHSVIAFGGGALVSAVALVLVPEGIGRVPVAAALASFAGGGLSFMLLDVLLAKRQTSASQLVAMLSDFVPESIALGAGFASGAAGAPLLALLIGLQNLPEGFNAYRELRATGDTPARTLIARFFMTAALGPVAGVAGYLLLTPYPATVGCLMLFAGGGILYLVFQDIAPQAALQRRWFPAMGSVLGFLLGMAGKMLLG